LSKESFSLYIQLLYECHRYLYVSFAVKEIPQYLFSDNIQTHPHVWQINSTLPHGGAAFWSTSANIYTTLT